MHIDFIPMVTAGHLKASQYKQFICNPLVKLNMKIKRKETGSREELFVRKCRRLSAEIPCTPNCPLPLQNVRNVLNFFLFFFHNQGKNIPSFILRARIFLFSYLGEQYFFFHVKGKKNSPSIFRARMKLVALSVYLQLYISILHCLHVCHLPNFGIKGLSLIVLS